MTMISSNRISQHFGDVMTGHVHKHDYSEATRSALAEAIAISSRLCDVQDAGHLALGQRCFWNSCIRIRAGRPDSLARELGPGLPAHDHNTCCPVSTSLRRSRSPQAQRRSWGRGSGMANDSGLRHQTHGLMSMPATWRRMLGACRAGGCM